MIDKSLWNKGIGYISYKWFRSFKILTNFEAVLKLVKVSNIMYLYAGSRVDDRSVTTKAFCVQRKGKHPRTTRQQIEFARLEF